MRTATPTIDDLITRGIPGAVVVAAFFVGGYQLDRSILDSSSILIAFLALSYTCGTFLDLHKHDIFTAPPYLRRILYEETKDEQYLRLPTRVALEIRRSSIGSMMNEVPKINISKNPEYGRESAFSDCDIGFIEAFEQQEDIEISPDNLDELWLELERATNSELGRIGENQHTVYHFSLNLFLSIAISAGMLISSFLYRSMASAQILFLITLLMVFILLVEVNLFGSYGSRYTRRLVAIYYSMISSNGSENVGPAS
ncbi:hypothetical protein [Halarchaeum sp. P4]|uniref:hypothetical protein n=1 Tax=Halarchaeum sp. P4 TaxID=3421639 RepID=UPI003EBBE27E